MKVSSALMSQSVNLNLIYATLVRLNRLKWEGKHNRYDLYWECWANGVWVKQAGIISYKDLAHTLREQAAQKAFQLSIEEIVGGWLVKSFQAQQGIQRDDTERYLVKVYRNGWICNCKLYKCRLRTQTELPQLWRAMGDKSFCHHIAAAYFNKTNAFCI